MIEAVGAGQEFDALVATRVMGWHRVDEEFSWWVDDNDEIQCYVDAFNPSNQHGIAAAHQVIRELNRRGYGVSVDYEPDGGASISVLRVAGDDCWKSFVILRAETAPLAICRAALEALGGDRD